MGGRLALHALLEKGHGWQAAVIVAAHPGLAGAAERESRRAADAAWATRALTGNWQEFLADWDAQPLLAQSALLRDAQGAARLVMRRREIARGFVDWSLGAQQPLWDRLPEIAIPVLWVAGENDPKFLALAQQAVAQMPTATLAVAPAAGHRVPWEAEAWLAAQTAHFLRGGA
jgi:2-succinyl-6-hydroxy-2,4-cyclohexadiene-1-carboxylate synthase